ncbi:hypothetical protein GPECTOR_26g550 [Gonium pectorale]|uniref:Uncharacterized protein n=1 Tax=Gonium pectorale TaxID=33097 RepID=A0A150GFL4_GONPE|nr:hypothetical protein GPECTOR_26g550 [Gonium pectorale]|eukprot:KXZ48647.1 hypothetical protein GPECTOR_26g550 [Gonium pectorale]
MAPQARAVADFQAHERDVWCVAFDPTDGNLLATCSYDGTAAVWDLNDLRSPRRAASLRGHRGDVRCIAWRVAQRPTGGTAAAAATASSPLPPAAEGAEGAEAMAMATGAAAAGASPPLFDKWLVTAGRDATVRLWSYSEAVRRQEMSYMCPWALNT